MRQILKGFGLALVSLLLAIIALECVLRATRPVTHRSVSVNSWDPEVGTRQVPNARGFVRCPEYDIDIVVNSHGLRDREFTYSKPGGTRRILCLGDSFVCGYGVDAESTLAKVLERRLGSAGEEVTWEVLNGGVGSTGTAHQLAGFLKDGWRYEPDLVVLGFFAGNDFSDSFYSGLYTLDGGGLTKHPAPRTGARRAQAVTRWIPGYDSFLARSHLLNLIKRRVASLHYRRLQSTATAGGAAVQGAESRDLFPEMRALTFELLRRLHDECRDRACGLVVLVIPASETTLESPDPRVSDLLAFLSDEEIAHLDLTPVFASQGGLEGLRYPLDKHWNADGHRVAAELLCDLLEDHSFLGSTAEADVTVSPDSLRSPGFRRKA